MTVGIYADRLELKRALVPREPYLVAIFTTDNDPAREVRVQTAPARGVTRRKPLDFAALELVPPGHYQWIAGSVVVMESDQDFRLLGDRLDRLRHLLASTRLGRTLAAGVGAGSAGAATAAVGEVAGVVIAQLKNAGDDHYATFEVRLDRRLAKRGEVAVDEGFEEGPLVFENSRVRLTLRCASTASEGSPAEWKRAGQWSDVEVDDTVRVHGQGELVEGLVVGRPGKKAIVDIGGGQELEVGKLKDLEIWVGEPAADIDPDGDDNLDPTLEL